jgi:hypothetical protein
MVSPIVCPLLLTDGEVEADAVELLAVLLGAAWWRW